MTTTIPLESRSPSHYTVVGTRPIRHDGLDKVTGRAKFSRYPPARHAARQSPAQPPCPCPHPCH